MGEYVLTVTRIDKGPVRFRPGGQYELDLIEQVVSAAKRRGLGVMYSEAHVERSIREAFAEVLVALKSEVIP